MPRNHAVSDTIAFSELSQALRSQEAARLTVQASDEHWFRMESSDRDSVAHIYITDMIGGWFGVDANDFVRELTAIDKENITLHLNSEGGAVFDAVMIYNALKTHKANVLVQVEGIAASAASFIAQAGDEVVMMDGAMMMIHDASGIVLGNAQDMRDTADVLDKVSNNIAKIYAKRAGEDQNFWRELMKQEVWYDSAEAVTAGLADRVDEAPAEDVSDKVRLPVFNWAGRKESPNPRAIRELVFNRLKEAPVSGTAVKSPTKVKNEDEKETLPPEAPRKDDEERTGERGVGTEEPRPNEDNPPTSPATGDQPQNAVQFTYVINGERVSDPRRVQNWITAQERSQSEMRTQNRKEFIKNLVTSNRLLATQVEATEELVIGDGTADNPGFTDKQYEKWCASWDAASPVSGLMRNVGNGNGGREPASGDQEQLKDQLEINRDIVLMHRRGNMPQNMLEETDSWKFLKKHNALDTL
jgi:ATP-dependent protease ClpP protease subunit